MKKTLIILAASVAVVASTHAQGLITFANSANAGTKIGTNSIAGGLQTGLTAGSGGQYNYALLFTSNTNGMLTTASSVNGNGALYAFQDPTHWNFANDYATNTAGAGRLFEAENADQSTTVNGVAAGGNAYIVVIGWSSNIGSTVAELAAWYANPTIDGWIGQSVVSGLMTFGDGALLPTPSVFGAAGPSVQGFTLGFVSGGIVPEPTTLALAGLGAASLLIFRRRK